MFVALLAVAAAQFGGLLGGGKGGNPLNPDVSTLTDTATNTLNLFTKQFGDFQVLTQLNTIFFNLKLIY